MVVEENNEDLDRISHAEFLLMLKISNFVTNPLISVPSLTSQPHLSLISNFSLSALTSLSHHSNISLSSLVSLIALSSP